MGAVLMVFPRGYYVIIAPIKALFNWNYNDRPRL